MSERKELQKVIPVSVTKKRVSTIHPSANIFGVQNKIPQRMLSQNSFKSPGRKHLSRLQHTILRAPKLRARDWEKRARNLICVTHFSPRTVELGVIIAKFIEQYEDMAEESKWIYFQSARGFTSKRSSPRWFLWATENRVGINSHFFTSTSSQLLVWPKISHYMIV